MYLLKPDLIFTREYTYEEENNEKYKSSHAKTFSSVFY